MKGASKLALLMGVCSVTNIGGSKKEEIGAISYITLTLSSILIIVHFILEVIKLLLL